jgi:hypothetical protein
MHLLHMKLAVVIVEDPTHNQRYQTGHAANQNAIR